MTNRSALLIGATGLVGGFVLDELLRADTWSRVVTIGRRDPEHSRDARLTSYSVDFDDDATWEAYVGVTDVFCTLGTTIKKAGRQEAFRHVDSDIPLSVAKRAREAGAEGFHVVSAFGADPTSSVFYSRVKGEVERELRLMQWPRLTVVRPSLLLGNREEFRFGEAVGRLIGGALAFAIPRRYRPVHARNVAAKLVSSAAEARDGERIIENGEIARFQTGR